MNIAQINIAKMLKDKSHPIMVDFVNSIDKMNEIADKHKGFVWRWAEAYSDSDKPPVWNDNSLLVNFSVWDNIESLKDYVYKSTHIEVLKRKKEWFRSMPEMHMAMWYVDENTIPTLDEALNKLEHIRNIGITPLAFNFRQTYTESEYLDFIG